MEENPLGGGGGGHSSQVSEELMSSHMTTDNFTVCFSEPKGNRYMYSFIQYLSG